MRHGHLEIAVSVSHEGRSKGGTVTSSCCPSVHPQTVRGQLGYDEETEAKRN